MNRITYYVVFETAIFWIMIFKKNNDKFMTKKRENGTILDS